MARRAERAQHANLRPPLGDGNRKRVVDDEHADEEREHARYVHGDGIHGQRALELLAARGWRFHVDTNAQRLLNGRPALPDGNALLELQVDAIEAPAAAEYLFGGVDVHDGQIAAERGRQSTGSHDASYRERLVSHHRREGELAAY